MVTATHVQRGVRCRIFTVGLSCEERLPCAPGRGRWREIVSASHPPATPGVCALVITPSIIRRAGMSPYRQYAPIVNAKLMPMYILYTRGVMTRRSVRVCLAARDPATRARSEAAASGLTRRSPPQVARRKPGAASAGGREAFAQASGPRRPSPRTIRPRPQRGHAQREVTRTEARPRVNGPRRAAPRRLPGRRSPARSATSARRRATSRGRPSHHGFAIIRQCRRPQMRYDANAIGIHGLHATEM